MSHALPPIPDVNVGRARGPAARFRIGAASVRIGLGLRQLRSPNGFAGWVTLDQSRAVETWKLIVVLVAGSAAQALLGGMLAVAAFLVSVSGHRHSLLVLGAIYCMIAATLNLLPSKDRRNDGAQMADLLVQAKDGSPEPPAAGRLERGDLRPATWRRTVASRPTPPENCLPRPDRRLGRYVALPARTRSRP
jgi:hypothetical protein